MAKRKHVQDEVEELEQAYTNITGYRPKAQPMRRSHSKKLVFLCFALVLILALCGSFTLIANHGSLLDNVLKMNSVTIGGINMTGLTKAEAKVALQEQALRLGRENMVIQVADSTLILSPSDIGIQPDSGNAVNAAFREDAAGIYSWIPYLHLNEEALRGAVDSLGKQYNTEFSQTIVQITGERPSLEGDASSTEEGMVLSITIGRPQYGLDTGLLYQQILDAYNNGVMTVTGQFSMLEPETPDLDAIYERSYVAPVNASMDPKTFVISDDLYGYHFDLEAAKAALAQAQYGQTLEFSFEKIAPTVTAANLSSKLFCDVLGSAKTPYTGQDTNNRNTNIALACEAINGLILLPGESFSYNETLGERTAEAGYKKAPSYVGGLTVDTYGGGICQVSSTLYYSALFADLEILERYNHGYISNYIDKGMDATVTWGGADLRIANNTDYPIRIEAHRADGYVSVQILGTDERDYYIKMSYNVREHTPYETVYQDCLPDNPEGYTDGQVIVTPYDGYIVQTYKARYSKETNELLTNEFWTYDIYKKRDKVICRITDTAGTNPTGSTEVTEATEATESTESTESKAPADSTEASE